MSLPDEALEVARAHAIRERHKPRIRGALVREQVAGLLVVHGVLAYQLMAPLPPDTGARISRRTRLRVLAAATVVLLGACNLLSSDSANDGARDRSAQVVAEPPIDHAHGVRPEPTEMPQTAGPSGRPARELTPQDALLVVAQSDLQFLAPQRKGKVKVYGGEQFARMLRNKWEWLGADIEGLERFIEEVASDAFATFEPYRVRHPDGREQDFSTWLRTELDRRRPEPADERPQTGEEP
jgi:hypothetical protein